MLNSLCPCDGLITALLLTERATILSVLLIRKKNSCQNNNTLGACYETDVSRLQIKVAEQEEVNGKV